jgi:hypothetical protein
MERFQFVGMDVDAFVFDRPRFDHFDALEARGG